MKKTIGAGLVALLIFVMPLSVTHADEGLNKGDIRAMAPQISQVLGSVTQYMQAIAVKEGQEKVLLQIDGVKLATLAERASELSSKPASTESEEQVFQAQLDDTFNQLLPISADVQAIAARRTQTQGALDAIGNTLQSLISAISSVI